MELSEKRYRQLVDISLMHYKDGLTQQEVADRIGLSRPQISKLLALAREVGIVKIEVQNPFSEEYQAETQLKSIFGLHEVSVVSAPNGEKKLVHSQMARKVAAFFEAGLKANDVLGILSGNTISEIGKEIQLPQRERMTVVSMSGGSELEENRQANNCAHYFADKFQCRFLPVMAPLIVARPELKQMLEREPEISKTRAIGRSASVALVGIGAVNAASPFFQEDMLGKEVLNRLKQKGAVAGLSGDFIDRSGNVVPYEENNRVLAIPAENLRRIPKVIAVAFGTEKVEAIEAVLNGKWADIFVTNLETAKALIAQKTGE